MAKKILVVGGGGREHAIIKALKKSPDCGEIWCAPGNGGISYDAKCKNIKATDVNTMVAFAAEEQFDYVVVAQDDPLALGMVDALAAVGIPAFGPDKAAARIEASKVFSKDLMKKYGIPTARYETFDDPEKVMDYIKAEGKYPVVIKADGLALGKGVLVAPTVHGNLLVGPNAEPVEGNDTSCTSSGLEFVKTTAQRSVPSINFGESIRSFAGVRANLDVDDFIIGEEPEAPGWIDLAGMKSPGLSAAPAVAEEAVAILQQRGVLGAEKADYKDGRRHIRFKELSAEEKAALVREQPAYGRVICRCETITEGEILAALHSEVPATTIDGVKRRAGAGMGRCQGGFCGPRVLELISRELGIDPLDILQDKNGSNVLVSETKVGGKSNG